MMTRDRARLDDYLDEGGEGDDDDDVAPARDDEGEHDARQDEGRQGMLSPPRSPRRHTDLIGRRGHGLKEARSLKLARLPADHQNMQRSTVGVLLLVLGVALGVFVVLPFSARAGSSCGPAIAEAMKSSTYRPPDTNPIDQAMGDTVTEPLVARPCVQPARRRLEIAGVLGVAGVVLILGIPAIVKREAATTAGKVPT